MKRYAIILVLLTLLAVAVRAQAPKRYSVESAIRFIDMARAAEQGKMPAEADWQSLFSTQGYHAFSVYAPTGKSGRTTYARLSFWCSTLPIGLRSTALP